MRAARTACLLLLCAAGCARPAPTTAPGQVTLRVAVSSGHNATSSPASGLAQVKQNLSLESLVGFDDSGRPRPAVAESWSVAADRRVVTLRLRQRVEYQDGTPVTAAQIAESLKRALPRQMAPASDDIESIRTVGDRDIELRFKHPSGFGVELLDFPVRKPGSSTIGTGPFVPVPGKNELRSNDRYYLGKPLVDRISIESYPSVRSAWADLLRSRNDMLYEVGVDALDSLQNATNVAKVFVYPRRYQYLIALNTQRPTLQSPAFRQALNLAIDRGELVRDALNGLGEASVGPVSPREWAVSGHPIPQLKYDAQRAAALLKTASGRKFTCLVLPDHERLALVVRRQLEAVGVEMNVEEVDPNEAMARFTKRDFDAILVDAISGPTMFRLYRLWHSGGDLGPTSLGTAAMDAALDIVRDASSDEEYRRGVIAVQTASIEDPPAIFLAWSRGIRAVSSRFDVPSDSAVDPIGTLRLWKPTIAGADASRN